MFSQKTSITGTGQSDAIELVGSNPFNVSLFLVISGTVTCTVEHSDGDGNWYPHEFLTDVAETSDGNYQLPVHSVRVNVTAGTGTATLKVIQAV